MAVTVVKKPTGHKIIDQAIDAYVTDSSGDALVTSPYHGLGTGDTVYITSDIDEYNGFWYVTSIDVNTFKISEYATADFVEYFQDLDIEYYQTNEHVWNSVFLPIVYKCSNTRWPINTVDAVRTISSFTDDNGYTKVVTSANLKLIAANLEFVKISGSADEDLNGVWQIIEVIGTLNYVLDLPYDSSSALIGASIQYYYSNYQVGVKIYGGLPVGHPWQAKKPFVEVAELSLTPDEDGIVMFSVADYIKSKVAIKNNTTLFSLPLNLDAFTAFYISVNESYDISDGYTLGRQDSSFSDDSFEGYAVSGKLPFKNIYSGDYSDYIYTDSSPALWLTMLDRLLAVEDKYFDVSFIKNVTGDFNVIINKYVSDYLATVETLSFTDQGIGVYRIPITVDSAYDSFCIQVVNSVGLSLNNADFANNPDTGINWTTGASPSVVVPGGGSDSDFLYDDYAFVVGQTYSVVVSYNSSAVTLSARISVIITDSSFNTQFSNGIDVIATSGNTTSIPIVFTATALTTRIAIKILADGFTGVTVTINSGGVTVSEANVALTEEICIDIIESCETQGGFVPTDIRLLEDGSYRLLE